MEAESGSSTSQDSLASLTAGDVLVRSTGVRGVKGAAGAGGRNSAAVSVTKLREALPSRQAAGVALSRGETPCEPPVPSSGASSGRVTEVTACSAAPGIYVLHVVYFLLTVHVQVRFKVRSSQSSSGGPPVLAVGSRCLKSVESQNVLSWKEPTTVTEPGSTQHHTNPGSEWCPSAPWALAVPAALGRLSHAHHPLGTAFL